jgi:hypothetical protein
MQTSSDTKEGILMSNVPPESFAYTLGLLAGEGSFFITFTRDDRYNHDVYFGPKMSVSMGQYSQEMLEHQQAQYGLGTVNTQPKGYSWTLSARDECQELRRLIEQYLDEHPETAFTSTPKHRAFQSWSKALDLLQPGKSLSKSEVAELAELRDDINYLHAANQVTTEEIKQIINQG